MVAVMMRKPIRAELAESGRNLSLSAFSEQHDIDLIVLGLKLKDALERAGHQMPLEKFMEG